MHSVLVHCLQSKYCTASYSYDYSRHFLWKICHLLCNKSEQIGNCLGLRMPKARFCLVYRSRLLQSWQDSCIIKLGSFGLNHFCASAPQMSNTSDKLFKEMKILFGFSNLHMAKVVQVFAAAQILTFILQFS